MLSLIALAFPCPTIATGTPSSLSFDTAQVAIVRRDGRTSFSVSVNPAGDPQSFALVMPVPEILEESEIHTLNPDVFARLDGYTAPRHVSDAGCPSSGGGPQSDTADAGDTGAGGGDDEGSVDVEAEYLVGQYEVVILSAEESSSLATWLDDNGYYLPEGADERLAEYIEAGSYFLAAKVSESSEVATGAPLTPLQVSYDSEIFSIPIRLATLNSPGEQDLIIYAITKLEDDADAGEVSIANYTGFEVPQQCVWGDAATDDFSTFYNDLFNSSWTETGGAAWTVEFAGGYYDCNPCSGTTITDEDLGMLGFWGDPYEHHLTRIHMRYTPEQATSDLVLYGSGLYEPMVTAYADDVEANYACVDSFCDGTATPGTEDTGDESSAEDGANDDPSSFAHLENGCDCDATGGAPALLAAAAAIGAVRRHRKHRVKPHS